jgi:hypothetical protein
LSPCTPPGHCRTAPVSDLSKVASDYGCRRKRADDSLRRYLDER